MPRVVVTLLIAGLLTGIAPLPTPIAAGQETGAVVFTIILTGPVDPSDQFGPH